VVSRLRPSGISSRLWDTGLRQLADIAVKALSPSVNDPTTATTCIGYLQAILEQLAAQVQPAAVRRYPDMNVTLVMRPPGFVTHLEALVQIGRYATTDARVVEVLLHATHRVAQAAMEAGATEYAAEARLVTNRIARRALGSDTLDEEERAAVTAFVGRFPARR